MFIPSWYKTLKEPLNAPFMEEQARMWQRGGHNVEVFVPYWSGSFIKGLKNGFQSRYDCIEDQNLLTHRLFFDSLIPRSFEINISIYIKKIKRKIRMKPDIIHSHSVFSGGYIAMRLSKDLGVPFFLTEHNSFFIRNYQQLNSREKKVITKVFQHAEKILMVSNFQKEVMQQNFGIVSEKLKCMPNIVNPIFFQNKKTISYIKGQPFKFLSIGHLIRVKNFELAIDAIHVLKNKYKIELTIIGKGPERQRLENKVKRLRLNNHVFFVGEKSRIHVMKLIQKTHALLSTSSFETFGVTLIESLAIGRPLVVTNSGGPRDIVNKSNGLLVEKQDSVDVVNAIEQLIRNYDQYDQLKISDDCYEKYSEEKILNDLEQLVIESIPSLSLPKN